MFDERLIYGSVGLVFFLGLLMVFSTTSAEALDQQLTQGVHGALVKHLGYAAAGCALAYGVCRMGYRRCLALSPFLLFVLIILLVAALMPGIGREINGSKRWINFFGFSFQPSEFVKYVAPAFLIQAYIPLQGPHFNLRAFLQLIRPLAAAIALIVVEPNNGTALVIVVTLLVTCLLLRIPAKFWALPLVFCLVLGGLFASQLPYIQGRIYSYMHPELDLRGKGHQPYQAKIAVGSGGVWGKGPGNSLQKLSYLPEAQNDYIAAIYAEEMGFLGIMGLISCYMAFLATGFSIALRAEDPAAGSFAGTITFLIGLQAFLNLGVVVGLLPSTGLNLPLFSQGGTSLIANLMGVGLLYDICRRQHA